MRKIKLLPLLLLLTISQILHAQNNNSIAVSYGLAANSLYRLESLVGAGYHEGNGSNIIEVFFTGRICLFCKQDNY